MSQKQKDWYRDWFNEDYVTVYSERDEAQADAEVEFAVDALGVRNGETVLDLCCGFGRHLAALGRRGVCAVGVDLSLALLRRAASARGLLVCADMRALPFADGSFPVVVNFFNSFGYFQDEADHRTAARELSRTLARGGRFFMDLMNAEHVVERLEPVTVRAAGPVQIREERRHDAGRRRVEKAITLSREDGFERRYFESVRIFTAEEILAILTDVGLTVEALYGGLDRSPLGRRSERMLVIGAKGARAR